MPLRRKAGNVTTGSSLSRVNTFENLHAWPTPGIGWNAGKWEMQEVVVLTWQPTETKEHLLTASPARDKALPIRAAAARSACFFKHFEG